MSMESMRELAERVVFELEKRNFTITTAESCTGGLLVATLLQISGASSVLNESYVTYSNDAKEKLLHVKEETLMEYGAVSIETAREMAIGVAKQAKADVALSTTGIAGPTGGTEEKPVGLVYVGCYMKGDTSVMECRFLGNRDENRWDTVKCALEYTLERLSFIEKDMK